MGEYVFNSFYMQQQNILLFIKELSEEAFLLVTLQNLFNLGPQFFFTLVYVDLYTDNVPYYYGIVYVKTVKDMIFLTI